MSIFYNATASYLLHSGVYARDHFRAPLSRLLIGRQLLKATVRPHAGSDHAAVNLIAIDFLSAGLSDSRLAQRGLLCQVYSSHQTHHSIHEDDHGNLWVGVRRRVDQPRSDLPKLSVPFLEEFIVQVAPSGEILREISMIDVILKSRYESILFADGHDGVGQWGEQEGVEMHMNDIEILGAAKAKAFPLFEEGDIMVSIRNLNWIVVIDPDTELIKWSKVGPYLRQHDPDFLDDGKISVFDNRRDDAEGVVLGASRILGLDPITRKISTLYESEASNFFYTEQLGKQQQLPNGNILMVEGQTGRAFEVAPEGEVVWSYINRWDEDEVAWIWDATRYPMHHAAFAKEEC